VKKLLLLVLAAVLAAAAGLLPFPRRDVGSLLPVRALSASYGGGVLTLRGGDGLEGRGAGWDEAMDDLRASAPGDAFFGCTGELILAENAARFLPDAVRDESLRPACRVYLTENRIDPETAADYLGAHPGTVTLQSVRAAALEGRRETPPTLRCEDGRYELLAR